MTFCRSVVYFLLVVANKLPTKCIRDVRLMKPREVKIIVIARSVSINVKCTRYKLREEKAEKYFKYCKMCHIHFLLH